VIRRVTAYAAAVVTAKTKNMKKDSAKFIRHHALNVAGDAVVKQRRAFFEDPHRQP
jgi:hypothetical protein